MHQTKKADALLQSLLIPCQQAPPSFLLCCTYTSSSSAPSYPLLAVHDRWCAVIPSFPSLLCLSFRPEFPEAHTHHRKLIKKTTINSSKRQQSSFVEASRLVPYVSRICLFSSPLRLFFFVSTSCKIFPSFPTLVVLLTPSPPLPVSINKVQPFSHLTLDDLTG